MSKNHYSTSVYLPNSLKMQTFPLTIMPNDDGTFTVVSSMFNIVTEGNTLEEAIHNGQEAIQCHVNGYKKHPDEERLSPKNLKSAFTTFVEVYA